MNSRFTIGMLCSSAIITKNDTKFSIFAQVQIQKITIDIHHNLSANLRSYLILSSLFTENGTLLTAFLNLTVHNI